MTERLERLQAMYKEDPSDSFLVFAIAKEYEKLGKLDLAIQEYESLKEKDPQYVGLYYHLAHLLVEIDQPSKAMLIYEEGITVAKKLADFHALSELINAKKNLELEGL